MYSAEAANAIPISASFICDKNTDIGCLETSVSSTSGCSTMFQ